MPVNERTTLSIEQFLSAIAGRDGRYELVEGIAYAMAGGTQRHNIIASNVQVALAPAGKRHRCRTTASDMAVKTGPGTLRFPDVVVDCGPFDPRSMLATGPRLIVEVSSPGTAVFDYGEKLREYQAVPTVRIILQVESEFVFVRVHRRYEDGAWTGTAYESLEDRIAIEDLALTLPLAEIYDTLDIRPRLRLVHEP